MATFGKDREMNPLRSLVMFLLLFSPAWAQSHTLKLEPGQVSPPATLADLEWVVGCWRGEAFGGQVEEIWSAPLGDSMMGSFKLIGEGKTKFYELETIQYFDSTLVLRLKHFHSDLRGWEDRDETVDFQLVKVTENKVFFDGYTFERIDDDHINVYVRMEDDKEAEFRYTRFKL